MKNFIQEFKEFAIKGNAFDLAIGVVIGGAFGKIITSLVENILTPLLGLLLGGKNFETLALSIGSVSIQYGAFLASVIDFLIIAIALFVVVRVMIKVRSLSEMVQK